MTIKIIKDMNLDEKSINVQDDKLTINVSTNPNNKLKKTENGLEVLIPSGLKLKFGTETKSVNKVQINGKEANLVFTEVLNHTQKGKRIFVCTDVIQEDNSLIYTESSEN